MRLRKYSRLIGVIILCIILYRIDLGTLIAVIQKVDLLLLFVAILLIIPHIFIKSFRWNRLLQSQHIDYRLLDSFIVYLISIYMGILTPGRIGEFAKAIYLKSNKNISISKGFSNVFVDRLFDLYLLIILGIIGIWKFDIFSNSSRMLLIILGILIIVPVVMLNRHFMRKLLLLLYRYLMIQRLKDNIDEKFEDFYHGIDEIMNCRLISLMLLTCFSYSIYFIQCYLIVIAMGISIEFISISFFMAIANLISFIPISISGIGTREASLIYLFSLENLAPELAVSYAFLIFFTFYICGGLMGVIAWWIKPLRRSCTFNSIGRA